MPDEDAVQRLLDKYWSEWLLAGDPPDPARADFLALLTGDSLQREVADLQKISALGEARRLPPQSKFGHFTIKILVSGATATATECVVDDVQIVEVSTGAVVNGAVSVFTLEKTIVRQGDSWALQSSRIVEEREGLTTCAG